jgi:hypothetical protein
LFLLLLLLAPFFLELMIGGMGEIDLICDFLLDDDDDDPKPANFFVGGGTAGAADLLNGLVKLLNQLACSVWTVPPSSSNSKTKGRSLDDDLVVPSLPLPLPCFLKNFIAFMFTCWDRLCHTLDCSRQPASRFSIGLKIDSSFTC